MPNIAGYLAFIIPVAMATGGALGLNPMVCGLAVVVVGDSVVYYPAAATQVAFSSTNGRRFRPLRCCGRE